ncbi:MAG: TrkA C-terminal domain-containing protein [Halobacteriaceae archaeon]
MTPLQFDGGALAGELVVDAAEVGLSLGGVALLAAVVAGAAALVHRAYTRSVLSDGVAALVALSAVALYLNAATALGQVVQGGTGPLATNVVAFNVGAIAVGALATPVGKRVGDRVATDLFTFTGVTELHSEVSDFARAVGLGTTLTLPAAAEMETVEGYDPVPETTRRRLGGLTFVFPRAQGADALRAALAARLEEEYGVGYVDVEVDPAGGRVTYLALGDRPAGLGPTLAPGAAAVAVDADPPAGARPGDTVQAWAAGAAGPERLATGEVREVAGDAVTVVVDAADAPRLAGRECRLVTLPAEPRPEREFAALLRAADETMAAVSVAPESPLAGVPAGAIDATVVAVRGPEGDVDPIPSRTRPVVAGETVYVVVSPAALRRLEDAARGSEGAGETASTGAG